MPRRRRAVIREVAPDPVYNSTLVEKSWVASLPVPSTELASTVVLAWALLAPDPDQILIWFAGVAGAVTLVMVFVLC